MKIHEKRTADRQRLIDKLKAADTDLIMRRRNWSQLDKLNIRVLLEWAIKELENDGGKTRC